MPDNSSNKKRIAKNTVALYFSTIITMLVGLYTSRVILQVLGVEDYGIYNVVGGFVSLFSLISGSLQSSVGRFVVYELGAGDTEKLKNVFSTSFFVMIGLSFIIVLATETVGIWYLYSKMVIPANRLSAANWCFQLSIASFVVNLLSTPYQATIIAHEKMGIYAYMSILDATFRLLICFAIQFSPIDSLVFYAILLFAVGIIDQIIYWIFCKRKFVECTLHAVFNKALFKQMFSFAGWNFIGSSAAVLRSQGATLLLNAFGGPVVNAANGIANAISGIVASFVNNFTQAFNPQITKKYASGEYESLMTLLIYGSKYSYYLMFIIALPVFFNAHFILEIWLGNVPEYTVEFTRWILVFLLAESISKPIITAKNANGKIRNYAIVVGCVLLLMLPISYIGLKLGMSVTFVAFSNALTGILAIFVRMYMLRGDLPCWSSLVYLKKVIFNVLIVSSISCIIPYVSYFTLPLGWTNLIITSILCVISSICSIYFIGCSKSEREIISLQLSKVHATLKSKLSNINIHSR